jgi:hypothetical protein
MLRRLFTVLSLLSLLLCAALIVVWVRSYWNTDQFDFHYDGGHWRAASTGGSLRVDNEPRRDTEQKRYAQQLAEHEAVVGPLRKKLQESIDLRGNTKTSSEERDRARADFNVAIDQYMRLSKAFNQTRQPISVPDTRAALPHAVAVASAAMLPLAWLAAVVARRRDRGRLS